MKKTPLYNLRRLRRIILKFYLTDSGMSMISGLILVGLLTLAIPAYNILASIISLFLIGCILGFIFRPRARLTGQLPEKIVAGKEVSVRFLLTNKSRLPAYDVALGFDEMPRSFKELDRGRYIPRVAPGETVPFDLRFIALRRGMYELNQPRVFSTFPLNIFRNGRASRTRHSILVLPGFHQIDNVDIAVDTRYQLGGIALASNVGESPEYIGNREFQPGDSPRKIDPRAWARLAVPIVKEYNEEYYCHVALVLDTFVARRRRPKPAGYPAFEAAVSLTASLAESLSRGERIIDFFAAGPDLYVFRTGRHTAHFENLLDILACVEHCRKNPFEIVTPALQEQLRQTSSVVFIMLDWDTHREKALRLAVETGCHAKVIIVRDKPTSRPFHDAQSWSGAFSCLSPDMVHSSKLEQL
jgi:uncharacterized protein (DUF58 family)